MSLGRSHARAAPPLYAARARRPRRRPYARTGGLGATPSLPPGLAPRILRQAFTDLEVETQVLPTIRIRDPFGPLEPSNVGEIVKPRVSLFGPSFNVSLAPWGNPSRGVRQAIGIGVAITLTGLVYYAIKGMRA